MAVEIRTSEKAIHTTFKPFCSYMAWEGIQLRITCEDFKRFHEIFQAGDWLTKTSCLIDLIRAGMNKIGNDLKKNQKLPEGDE